jgi:excisionase family DNA binding protein
MFCPACGSEAKQIAAFCWKCGKPIAPSSTTPADAISEPHSHASARKAAWNSPPADPLINAITAAQYLGLSGSHVRKLARENRIPSIALPRSNGKVLHRFRVSDLGAYINSLVQNPIETMTDNPFNDLEKHEPSSNGRQSRSAAGARKKPTP